MVLNLCPVCVNFEGSQLVTILLGPICIVDLLQDMDGSDIIVYYGWDKEGIPVDTYSLSISTEVDRKAEEEEAMKLLWEYIQDPDRYL